MAVGFTQLLTSCCTWRVLIQTLQTKWQHYREMGATHTSLGIWCVKRYGCMEKLIPWTLYTPLFDQLMHNALLCRSWAKQTLQLWQVRSLWTLTVT